MNKKLIAAAIAAAVAAPVASAADTTLYGKAHLSIQSNDFGNGGENYTLNSNASRIGIKGSEDLGDGLKVIFGYEMGYEMSHGGRSPWGYVNNVTGEKEYAASFLTARNSYLGLSGGFGTILAGRHDTPMKIAFYAAGNDNMVDTVADFNKIGFTERRLNNAIAYVSPNFSGLTVAAAIVPGEGSKITSSDIFHIKGDAGESPAVTAGNGYKPSEKDKAHHLSDAYSLGMMYAGGGLKAGAGYEVATSDFTGGADDLKTWQVGASYTLGDITLGAQYENNSGLMESDIWGISGKVNFGNNYVVVNYGEKDPDGGNNDVTAFGFGVGHKFSKRTQVYAAYGDQDDDAGGDANAFALGMIHTF